MIKYTEDETKRYGEYQYLDGFDKGFWRAIWIMCFYFTLIITMFILVVN